MGAPRMSSWWTPSGVVGFVEILGELIFCCGFADWLKPGPLLSTVMEFVVGGSSSCSSVEGFSSGA